MKPEDSRDAVAQVAPAMAAYSEQFIEKDLWNRLNCRDAIEAW
jgi:4-carboxymuconolactone decarboxylase